MPDRPPAGAAGPDGRVALERAVTLHQLRTFKAVADNRSFSAAAQKLGLSQPSVSYQVKELEAAVGLPLLDRRGRGVALTEAGHTLFGYVRQTLNLIDEAAVAMEDLRGIRRGTLRVGASTTVGIYLMPAALGAFKRGHPSLVISLEIGNRGQVQDRVLRNDLDLAVVGPTLNDPELQSVPFLFDELSVVAPRGHPLAERPQLRLKDLRDEPFMMRETGSGTRWALEKAARRAGVKLEVGMELGSNGAIKHAVQGGLGLAVISRYATILERTSGDLVELPVSGFPIRRQWHIVYLRRRRIAGAVRAFIDFLREGEWRKEIVLGPALD
jgi:DNA-binding transcriptional LysR family regulator